MSRRKYPYELPDHKVKDGVRMDVHALTVEPETQRNLKHSRAKGIADNIVPSAIGTIIVAHDADTDSYYIVDGQHRWTACQMAGIKNVTCEVHYDLTKQQRAILFLLKNREASAPTPMDEYRIGLTAELPLFVDTDAILTRHGLAMGHRSTNGIKAIQTVLRIVDTYGPDVLDRTLHVAQSAWGRTADTWDGMLLSGISEFIGRHPDLLTDTSDDIDLADRLGKRTASKWVADINLRASLGGTQHSGTGSRAACAYQAVKDAWNRGRRVRKIAA